MSSCLVVCVCAYTTMHECVMVDSPLSSSGVCVCVAPQPVESLYRIPAVLCVPAAFGLGKAAVVTGARGLVPTRLPSSVIRSLMYACVLAGSVCSTISGFIRPERLRAPSSSLMAHVTTVAVALQDRKGVHIHFMCVSVDGMCTRHVTQSTVYMYEQYRTNQKLFPAVLYRPLRIMAAEKLAEFGSFSGKFHACLVCG